MGKCHSKSKSTFPSLKSEDFSPVKADQEALARIKKTWDKYAEGWSKDIQDTVLRLCTMVRRTPSNTNVPSSHKIWKMIPWNFGHWIVMSGIYDASKLTHMKNQLREQYPTVNLNSMVGPESNDDDGPGDEDKDEDAVDRSNERLLAAFPSKRRSRSRRNPPKITNDDLQEKLQRALAREELEKQFSEAFNVDTKTPKRKKPKGNPATIPPPRSPTSLQAKQAEENTNEFGALFQRQQAPEFPPGLPLPYPRHQHHGTQGYISQPVCESLLVWGRPLPGSSYPRLNYGANEFMPMAETYQPHLGTPSPMPRDTNRLPSAFDNADPQLLGSGQGESHEVARLRREMLAMLEAQERRHREEAAGLRGFVQEAIRREMNEFTRIILAKIEAMGQARAVNDN
ncbi:hypothetical protein ACHAPU_002502 [Fusarium lateritium]